jgi:D-glycero-D-manno-heptose 1,7-bisphosphate phosphatase
MHPDSWKQKRDTIVDDTLPENEREAAEAAMAEFEAEQQRLMSILTEPKRREPEDYKLIIFDKDGTLCRNKHDHDGFINHWDDQELIPGVAGKCKLLRDQGVLLAVASNQGGVAFGHMNDGLAYSIVCHAAKFISADLFNHCPFHPDGSEKEYARDDYDRKPRPGMLLKAMIMASAEPRETLMVGDRQEDQEAAMRAGCDFMWAHQFFNWGGVPG